MNDILEVCNAKKALPGETENNNENQKKKGAQL